MDNNTIVVNIEPHFAGDYRLEYDGKYITLFGKDNRYDLEGLFDAPKGTYEEMVLVPCVAEVRNADPVIDSVNDTHIIISLIKDKQVISYTEDSGVWPVDPKFSEYLEKLSALNEKPI